MTPTASLTDARALALELGLLAAKRLRQAGAQTLQVEEKAQGDWCSALDREIEQMLRERIAQRYPQHQFWGEESHSDTPSVAQLREQLVWVVDPIDGSMNFLRGYPQYAVSIALLAGGQPVVACIVDPVREEAYTAARGLGATCNGRPLAVASTVQLGQAVAARVAAEGPEEGPKDGPEDGFVEEVGACWAFMPRTLAGCGSGGCRPKIAPLTARRGAQNNKTVRQLQEA